MERFSRLDWVSIFLAVAATLIGVAVLYGGGITGEDLAQRKLIWLILCIVAMLVFANINYQLLGSFAPIIYAVGIFLLLLVLVPFIGKEVKGARSWLRIGGLGFQPAEFMKLIGTRLALITTSKCLLTYPLQPSLQSPTGIDPRSTLVNELCRLERVSNQSLRVSVPLQLAGELSGTVIPTLQLAMTQHSLCPSGYAPPILLRQLLSRGSLRSQPPQHLPCRLPRLLQTLACGAGLQI